MEQRFKTSAELDTDKYLRLDFYKPSTLNEYQDSEIPEEEEDMCEAAEGLNKELQEVGDASMYEYSREEIDQIFENARKERIVMEPNVYDKKI